MIDEEEVRLILRDTLLNDVTPLPSNLAWQNRPFVAPAPEEGEAYLTEEQAILTEQLLATEQVTVQGQTQFRVYVATSTGTEELSAFTLAIANAFKPGQSLRDIDGVPTDCPVQIWRTQRGQAVKDTETEAWYFQSVNIFWRVHVPNLFTP